MSSLLPRNLNFGEALQQLKDGKKLTREGWNGKHLFVELTGGTTWDFLTVEPFFVINNHKGTLNTWVPSNTDILAADWMVVSK
jgi:hypothetical protein